MVLWEWISHQSSTIHPLQPPITDGSSTVQVECRDLCWSRGQQLTKGIKILVSEIRPSLAEVNAMGPLNSWSEETSRGLMQGINMENSSQGCYKAIQICFCDSYHNKIIDIQNRLPYSKVLYPAIIVLFSCLMEGNHGAGSHPNYSFR